MRILYILWNCNDDCQHVVDFKYIIQGITTSPYYDLAIVWAYEIRHSSYISNPSLYMKFETSIRKVYSADYLVFL